MDPLLTKDGKLYAPFRLRELIRERYAISKNCCTSYVDVGKITPVEREVLLGCIMEDLKRKKEMMDNANGNNK